MLEIGSCELPQVADDSIMDEQLPNTLDKELSNDTYEEARNTMKDGTFRVMSRHSLNNNSDTSCQGFIIERTGVDTDKDSNENEVELENYGCRISYIEEIDFFPSGAWKIIISSVGT